MEASPHPEQALAPAKRLRNLVPDSSHMVHMPAHIYSRVGDWEKAATANRNAVKADALYRAAYPRPGFYSMYMAHNSHFLAWVYMMQARSQLAVDCARQTVAEIPDDFLKDYAGVVDGYMAIVPETLMRFGRWNEILKEPQPAEGLPLARALWRFTRASALIALERNEEAKTEQGNFVKAIHDVPADRGMGNNTASDLLAIAHLVLEGESSANRADFSTSVAKLKEAALLEDRLRYDEPPDWIQPVRHTLGAVLLRAGKPSEAEVVYQEDLRRNPENGWGLLGLRNALQAQGKARDARRVQQRLDKTWAKADVSPDFTCYCQASK
jgi:tetratricopeptide (TPR) repeat protein